MACGYFPASMAAEPMRIGTIESGTQTNQDSKPFTIQGEAGGYGAKTGLYAVPIDPAGLAGRGAVYPIAFGDEGQMNIETGTRRRVIYEVQDGQIAIKGRKYPIKLTDGFYIIRKLTVFRVQTTSNHAGFLHISGKRYIQAVGQRLDGGRHSLYSFQLSGDNGKAPGSAVHV